MGFHNGRIQFNCVINKRMSENFLRVKRDILRDMREISHHTQESWATIMLEHTQYLTTDDDQKSFWNFILNPTDERDYVPLQFTTYDSENVVIEPFQKLTITDVGDEKMEDVEITLENKVHRDGMTSFIEVKPVV